MNKPIAPAGIRKRQRTALIMLVIAGTLNYLDRSTLSIANPLIRQELGLSIADMGLLLSAFLWAYAFAQLPGGALVDRVGPHRLLAAGLGLWSIAQALAGFVSSFWEFSIARLFLGLGEAPMFSSAVSWCVTGTTCGIEACRPASGIAHRHWDRPLRRR